MTVCIAARCFVKETNSQYIVTVSDTKLTTGSYSKEMATLKLRNLSSTWKCLIAGKFAQSGPVIDKIIGAMSREMNLTDSRVRAICTEALIAENGRLAEEGVLSRYGLTMDTFLKSRESLGEGIFERLWSEIGATRFECDLLVCGFDGTHAHIFVATNPTSDNASFITDFDYPGFAAIGTGGYLAESTLYAFSQNPVSSLEETLYMTTTAKFIAESASDVGEQTFIYAFGADGTVIDIDKALRRELRERWKKVGRPRIPESGLTLIRQHVPMLKPKEMVASEGET